MMSALAAPVFSQQAASAPPANPITASEKGAYHLIIGNVLAAAKKMPEENYSFKPSPDVRTFGQLVGHEADGQYEFCSLVSSDPRPTKSIEQTKTTKADLVAALTEAIAYCDKAYAGLTDAEGSQMTKFAGFNLAKLSVMSINTAHSDEHYGNMVTYMRIKGLVPPSSEKRSASGQ
jgi:uncharacterized damage-inducible protein DinB